MILRQEEPKDYQAVFALIEQAFRDEQYTDHQEQFLVERLRKSAAFIPELSVVAVADNQIAGYILLTKLYIQHQQQQIPSLALAPIAVLPSEQGKGIGAALIEYAHEKARSLGYKSVILLGHEKYYPRFGYKKAASFGIELPFEAPEENCMAIELVTNGLSNSAGMVHYPEEFWLQQK